LSRGVTIACSSDVFNAYHMRFRTAAQEEFLLLCLNTKNQVIKEVCVSIGSLNQSAVHPREVFKEAIRESAHAVLFIHNHPSGDPRPSDADVNLTKSLKKAGEMLNIHLLDHIIVGDHNYFSFLDSKIL
jgi:DNA repair protein RadC